MNEKDAPTINNRALNSILATYQSAHQSRPSPGPSSFYRVARQFARRHSPQAVVFRSEIPAHHVLAMLSQHEEGEVVIDPWGLPRSKTREVG